MALRLASPQQSINRNKRTQTATQTKADPTTTWKTELQESRVQHDVLKCQMYFKGLGFPFSPTFRIVNDTNTRGLFSYSVIARISVSSLLFTYYICQGKKKRKHQALNHITSICIFFFPLLIIILMLFSVSSIPKQFLSAERAQPAEWPHTGATSAPNERQSTAAEVCS